jgi:hypothetical protein
MKRNVIPGLITFLRFSFLFIAALLLVHTAGRLTSCKSKNYANRTQIHPTKYCGNGIIPIFAARKSPAYVRGWAKNSYDKNNMVKDSVFFGQNAKDYDWKKD